MIPKTKISNQAKAKPSSLNRPALRPRAYAEGALIHQFPVKAQAGFTISPNKWHKFRFVNRGGFAVVEYCPICASIRAALSLVIDGKKVDYVQMAFHQYRPKSLAEFDLEHERQVFTDLLIKIYSDLKKK